MVDHLFLGDARGEKIKGMTGIFPPSLENAFGFRIAGLISHQFFRPYAVTFDFTAMRLFLEGNERPAYYGCVFARNRRLPVTSK
ncbi:MAG TPA: hypothetical protein VI386_27715, partial [Candidatus Sulfotelmatobacter sp.]